MVTRKKGWSFSRKKRGTTRKFRTSADIRLGRNLPPQQVQETKPLEPVKKGAVTEPVAQPILRETIDLSKPTLPQEREQSFFTSAFNTIKSQIEETRIVPGVEGKIPAGIKVAGATAALGGAGAITAAVVLKTAGAIATTSGIMTWLASDNMLSSMGIFVRDMKENVKQGIVTPEVALANLDEANQFIQEARNFININTAINPLLWPFRGIIMANSEKAQFVVDENRAIIQGFAEGGLLTSEQESEQFNLQVEENRERRRQEDLEQRQRDAAYFDLIREGKFQEAQALLDEELKGGK